MEPKNALFNWDLVHRITWRLVSRLPKSRYRQIFKTMSELKLVLILDMCEVLELRTLGSSLLPDTPAILFCSFTKLGEYICNRLINSDVEQTYPAIFSSGERTYP